MSNSVIFALKSRHTQRKDAPPGEWNAFLSVSLPTVVDGDLKSKHPSWNNRKSDHYGNSFRSVVVDKSRILIIGSTSPTHSYLSGMPRMSSTYLLPRTFRLIYMSSLCRIFHLITISLSSTSGHCRPHPDNPVALLREFIGPPIMKNWFGRCHPSLRIPSSL